jgi:hypothetical protein
MFEGLFQPMHLAMDTVSHRSVTIASPVDFKLHHYRVVSALVR